MLKSIVLLMTMMMSTSMISCVQEKPRTINPSLRVTSTPDGYFVPTQMVEELRALPGIRGMVDVYIVKHKIQRMPAGFHITEGAMKVLLKSYYHQKNKTPDP